jgi:hypothetical protein
VENKCCIVIPIYKQTPSSSELSALKQVSSKLKDYIICFICAENFDINNYTNELENKIVYYVEYFKPSYFSSIDGYNKLMLSIFFYKRFIIYEYILIFQLDAWIFKNDLYKWLNLKLDYIGAPWLHLDNMGNLIFDGTGNGGLSLRKVSSHIKVLKSFSWIKKPGFFVYLIKKEKTLSSIKKSIKELTYKNNTFHIFNTFEENEDKFWGIVAKRNFWWFKVAEFSVARRFSVELYPSRLIESQKDLPFGCHAWEKYEPEFWQKYISI